MILPLMLRDAMRFSELEEEEAARLLRDVEKQSWGFEYNKTFELKSSIRFKLGRAGHILGSCFIRFESREPAWSVLFSGDLGSRDTPLLPDPDPPEPCDLLILESTYGDTLHGDKQQRMERLGGVLTKSLSDGGKVFVPAFALGRTQELIYEMDRLSSELGWQKRFPSLASRPKIPVCLDSPLGLEITKVYSKLKPYWDSEAKEILRTGDDPLDFEHLYSAVRFDDHKRLMEMKGPAVIIAGSGMCSGGRILDHLKDGLEDSRNDVLFIGYQAQGTPGREILRNAGKPGGTVEIEGTRVPIRAGVQTLTGYSAHADSKGLVEWVQSMKGKPGRIKLGHGGAAAQKGLAQRLREAGYQVE
jgi:metallo-beta-lactamase family protein